MTTELFIGCSSGLHCEKCRHRITGRAWREKLSASPANSVDSPDFDCPEGKPWVEPPARPQAQPAVETVAKPTRPTSPRKRTKKTPVKVTPVPPVSNIGIYLKDIIEREVGAAMPCGECKSEVLKLNMETAEQVHARRDALADTIIKNGQEAAPKWWQRVALNWAPGIAKPTVLGWIDEAISMEIAARQKGG